MNNPFGVNELFTEKTVGWFAQAETVPESNFKQRCRCFF